MKKIIKSALLLMLVFALVFSAGCGKDKADAGGDADKVLLVGTEPTFPPFEMTDEKTGEICRYINT